MGWIVGTYNANIKKYSFPRRCVVLNVARTNSGEIALTSYDNGSFSRLNLCSVLFARDSLLNYELFVGILREHG